jgi:acetyl esterase/lipase
MAWVLTAAAVLLAAVVAVVAYYMVRPVDYTGPGRYGVFALLFPLHLLAITLVSAVFVRLAWWAGATTAAAIFAAVTGVSAAMALVPSIAVWRYARCERVALSLRTYMAHAFAPNFGRSHPERTLVYGTTSDGTELGLEVWRIDDAGHGNQHGAVVVVHGGGWVGGARGQAERWNEWLNELGYDVFDVDYRVPPPERWRDEVGDVKAAIGWVYEHADDYDIDRARISVMGHSAGGNLAMLAAYGTGNDAFPPTFVGPVVAVRSVVNVYGPADLLALYETSGSRLYIQECLQQYIGGTPTDHPQRYRAVSPLMHAGAAAPPTITVLGRRDRIVPMSQAHALDRVLRDAGVVHETYLLPGNDHGFDVNWGGFGTQIARAKVKDFLVTHG